MRSRARVLLPLVLSLAAAPSAQAAREWYDYYLQAREQDIPARRWADCVRNIDHAAEAAAQPGHNVRTYGMGFVDYLPYYYRASASWDSRSTRRPSRSSTARSSSGAIKKTPLHADLIRRRGAAQSAEAARLAREAPGPHAAAPPGGAGARPAQRWDEALALPRPGGGARARSWTRTPCAR